MTIIELLEREYDGCNDFEVYQKLNDNGFCFHTDSIKSVWWKPQDEVKEYEVMDEQRYNETVLANSCETADFFGWYGNKNAKIIVIAI